MPVVGRSRYFTFRSLLWAAVGFIGLTTAAMAYTVWKLRSDAIDDAYRDAANVATVLAEQIAQIGRSIDLVLGDIHDRIAALDVLTADDLRRAMSIPYGHGLLKSKAERFPLADVITLVGADGRLIATSRAWPSSRMDLSDREYFQHFKGSGESSTYISLPLANQRTGLATVFFVKPVRDERGELLGLLALGVPIERLRHIYETVGKLGDEGFMLSRRDGTILVRYPDAESHMGQKIPETSPWYLAVRDGGGRFRSAGTFIPDVRLVSVRPVTGYPLVTSVGVREASALAIWRQRSAFIAAGTLLAVICSLLFLAAIVNRVRLLRASQRSLAAKSSELERAKAQTDAAVNNISQGISMYDASQRLIVCNRRYLEIYGLSPDVVKPGCTFREILELRKSQGGYAKDPAAYVAESAGQVRGGKRFGHTAKLPDGRVIAVVINPTADGGWVATHEDITERHRTEALIAHMARHDGLTGLINRIEFEQKMSEALNRLNRHREAFALLMFDLDKFKAVNDTMGHPAGDALLRIVADRLRSCTRELDSVARLGGDEFAILQAHVDEPEAAARALASRLLDAIVEPIVLGGRQVKVGVSIGIALAPQDGSCMDELVKKADLALYRTKSAGRNGFRFFDARIDTAPAHELLAPMSQAS
jgi:diguanylate cyclase (GGDEF)-like protein